jgi:molybdenum cofactor biosynthesis protein MoaF
MAEAQRAAAVRGKTIRLTWLEGPTKGTTHEHVFHDDGTVEWRDAGDPPRGRSTDPQQQGAPAKEKPKYAEFRVADDIYAVSYLAASGYTLTVVLNFRDKKMVGFASSAKDWYPVQGTFEVMK